ncbi:MAG: TRAP transporter small permease subunit, partial [Desulfitobacterium hafniense]|nr:TRAP transporter small permease subunit [Desulfitobacterium hafniense]
MNSFVKGVDQINRLATWVVVIMTAVMSVIILAQVIFRYVLEAPLPWSEEVARYLMVWGTFLGAGLGVRKREI